MIAHTEHVATIANRVSKVRFDITKRFPRDMESSVRKKSQDENSKLACPPRPIADELWSHVGAGDRVGEWCGGGTLFAAVFNSLFCTRLLLCTVLVSISLLGMFNICKLMIQNSTSKN